MYQLPKLCYPKTPSVVCHSSFFSHARNFASILTAFTFGLAPFRSVTCRRTSFRNCLFAPCTHAQPQLVMHSLHKPLPALVPSPSTTRPVSLFALLECILRCNFLLSVVTTKEADISSSSDNTMFRTNATCSSQSHNVASLEMTFIRSSPSLCTTTLFPLPQLLLLDHLNALHVKALFARCFRPQGSIFYIKSSSKIKQPE